MNHEKDMDNNIEEFKGGSMVVCSVNRLLLYHPRFACFPEFVASYFV